MEAKLSGNYITLSFGTRIGFRLGRTVERKLGEESDAFGVISLIDGDLSSKFYALFEQNDVDFEIVVDNRQCASGIGYTLTINENYYDYYVGPRELWTMEALHSNGRKLHFITESTDEGKALIGESARTHGIPYEEAAALCSRIEFCLELERRAEPVFTATDVPDVVAAVTDGPQSTFNSVRSLGTFGSMSMSSRAGPDVLCRESRKSGVRGMTATDSCLLAKRTDDNAHVLAKPIPKPIPNREAHERTDAKRLVLESGFGESGEREGDGEGVGAQSIGERGVICFGEQSSQVYNPYGGFVKDKSLTVKPFTVELRIASR